MHPKVRYKCEKNIHLFSTYEKIEHLEGGLDVLGQVQWNLFRNK